jgi:hypothetical protein
MLYNNRIVDQIAYSKESKPPKDGWKKYFVVFFFFFLGGSVLFIEQNLYLV